MSHYRNVTNLYILRPRLALWYTPSHYNKLALLSTSCHFIPEVVLSWVLHSTAVQQPQVGIITALCKIAEWNYCIQTLLDVPNGVSSLPLKENEHVYFCTQGHHITTVLHPPHTCYCIAIASKLPCHVFTVWVIMWAAPCLQPDLLGSWNRYQTSNETSHHGMDIGSAAESKIEWEMIFWLVQLMIKSPPDTVMIA